MLRYTIRRLGFALLTLWLIVTLTFLMMHAIPGDPFLSEKKVPEAIRNNMLHKYGLDRPLWEQYVIYLRNILHGDLGISLIQPTQTVNKMIREGFPVSATLGGEALLFAVVTGISLGVVAGLNQNRGWDYAAILIAIIGVSVPNFVVASMLQYFVGVKLEWLPVARWGDFEHSIMPAFSLGLGTLAVMARMMRTTTLEVIGQDYIRTAKAKGLHQLEIVWSHILRNAILPVVTILGPLTANIITGTLIVEVMFGIPGLGKYYVLSIQNRDYTLILGTTVFYAAILILSIFLVDISYGFIDPRIRLVREKE